MDCAAFAPPTFLAKALRYRAGAEVLTEAVVMNKNDPLMNKRYSLNMFLIIIIRKPST
jgi:hypothetical protein